MSTAITRMLVRSSNLDENKDKVLEKSHKIISPVSYLLAAPFLPLQTRDQTHLNDVSVYVYRIANSTAALMYIALLSNCQASGHGFTSVTGRVMSPVALENFQNELHSDTASALATVYSVVRLTTRSLPHEVAFWQ